MHKLPRNNSANYAESVIHGAYQPHVDGIRALAVLPVLFFHLSAWTCPGGFTGVDVFFVISGYLITGGILRQVRSGEFSYANFYHRRIRRILPAYFALIVAVFMAACAVYTSTDIENTADATALGTLFSANYYYYKLSGDYFAPNIHNSPLLHLWSLSVEEQFYIFIPIICALLWKVAKHRMRMVLTALAVMSFALSAGLIFFGQAKLAFYALPSRAWEILAGALLVSMGGGGISGCAGARAWAEKSQWIKFAAPLGLVFVVASYFLYSSNTSFPGVAALLPVAGTMLMVRFGHQGLVARVLESQPALFFGRISYSLYLWHWPVIVIWRYIREGRVNSLDYLGMFGLSILLGYASWRFVEMPIRISHYWTREVTFRFAAIGIVALASLGTVASFQHGWPKVLHTQANKLIPTINQTPGFIEARVLKLMNKFGLKGWFDEDAWAFAYGTDGVYHVGAADCTEFLLTGDSHAGSLRFGANYFLSGTKRGGIVYSASSADVFIKTGDSFQVIENILTKYPGIKKIVISELWMRGDLPNRGRHFEPSFVLDQLAEFIRNQRLQGRNVYVLLDYPGFNSEPGPGDVLAKEIILGPWGSSNGPVGIQTELQYEGLQGKVNSRIASAVQGSGGLVLPLREAFREGATYSAFERHSSGSVILRYRNKDHLTPEGSITAARYWLPLIFPGFTPQITGIEEIAISSDPYFWKRHVLRRELGFGDRQ